MKQDPDFRGPELGDVSTKVLDQLYSMSESNPAYYSFRAIDNMVREIQPINRNMSSLYHFGSFTVDFPWHNPTVNDKLPEQGPSEEMIINSNEWIYPAYFFLL